MTCYVIPIRYKQESSDVQLEPIIPFPVELIMNFILFIQTNNERIQPPNIYPVIDFLSIYYWVYIWRPYIRSLLVCINK